MADGGWVYDDAEIADDSVLYRRIENEGDPKNFSRDRIHGTRCLGPAAFSASSDDKDPNGVGGGLSTHLEVLMKVNEIPTVKLADWERFGTARFNVRDVRDGGGGVVIEEDRDDPDLGKAHALMRSTSPGMMKRGAWSSARRFVLERAIYFASDPGYSDEV